MSTYSLKHLDDTTLRHGLHAAIARERASLAHVLAHVAEFDARKLYLPDGYASMYAYCTGALRFSEQAAYKRILVARMIRRFPALLVAIADGRLHLTAAVMLAPHLGPETIDELLAAATHRSRFEIERLLAQRFPRPDLPARLEAVLSPAPAMPKLSSRIVGATETTTSPESVLPPVELSSRIVAAPVSPLPALDPAAPEARPRIAPLAPKRFGLQVTIDEETHAMLRRAQELLSHEIPPHDLAGVLKQVLRIANARLEKRKFAATSRPHDGQEPSTANGRYVPARVRRAVWRRDGGRCTFVSDSGHRCEERRRIEFDHVREFARGGQATISGLRLRCRAHNQYGAECTYGAEFMRHKREQARHGSAARGSAAMPAMPAGVARLENSA